VAKRPRELDHRLRFQTEEIQKRHSKFISLYDSSAFLTLFVGHPQRRAKNIPNSSGCDYFKPDLLLPCNLYYYVINTAFLCSLRELLQFSFYCFSKQGWIVIMHVRRRICIHMHARHMKIRTALCMLFWWIYTLIYASVHFCELCVSCVCVCLYVCVYTCVRVSFCVAHPISICVQQLEKLYDRKEEEEEDEESCRRFKAGYVHPPILLSVLTLPRVFQSHPQSTDKQTGRQTGLKQTCTHTRARAHTHARAHTRTTHSCRYTQVTHIHTHIHVRVCSLALNLKTLTMHHYQDRARRDLMDWPSLLGFDVVRVDLAHIQCVAVCCSALQCVVVCRSALQSVAVCCSVLQCVAVCCTLTPCCGCCPCWVCVYTTCCIVLQCVVMRCTLLLQFYFFGLM